MALINSYCREIPGVCYFLDVDKIGKTSSFCFHVSGLRMAAVLLCFLLAAPVLLVTSSPIHDSDNGTVPLVLWHGMGK